MDLDYVSRDIWYSRFQNNHFIRLNHYLLEKPIQIKTYTGITDLLTLARTGQAMASPVCCTTYFIASSIPIHLKITNTKQNLQMDDLKLTPVLLIALFQKPHDRHFIVELENGIVSFMNSDLEFYELKPMNSYYRLLSHQIAEYHGLKHTLAKANNNCLVIYKGDSFVRDQSKALLQCLEPHRMYQYPTYYPQIDAGMEKPKKQHYKLLKRENSTASLPTPPETNSSSSSVDTDLYGLQQQRQVKEKEYQQVKSELFKKQEPTTPQKKKNDNIALQDDSPQPHQFETSRFQFNKPPQCKFRKKKHTYRKPSTGHYSVPFQQPQYPVPYMMYNPYVMMYPMQVNGQPSYPSAFGGNIPTTYNPFIGNDTSNSNVTPAPIHPYMNASTTASPTPATSPFMYTPLPAANGFYYGSHDGTNYSSKNGHPQSKDSSMLPSRRAGSAVSLNKRNSSIASTGEKPWKASSKSSTPDKAENDNGIGGRDNAESAELVEDVSYKLDKLEV